MRYTIYDTCPVVADKTIKKLKKELKSHVVSITEVIERTDHVFKTYRNGEYVTDNNRNCLSINVNSNRKPVRCKQCPVGLQNKGRVHSDMTTIIEIQKPVSFL